MDDQIFQKRADSALTKLNRKLVDAGDEYGFESDFNAGALTIEFEEPPAKFVVSPNAPVSQIWVSANVKSYKLDWDEVAQTFVQSSSRKPLTELIEDAIAKHIGREVNL